MPPEYRRVVWRLIVAQISLHATMSGVRMAAPLLALRSGHSAFSVGILLALFALAQVLLALPMGRLVDRHGLRHPVFLACLASSASVLLASLWPQFEVLCITAVLTGSASGTAMISVQRHAGRLSHEPADIRQIFSWMAIAPTLANFLGPFVTGLLIDGFGFASTFALLCGVPPLAAWAVHGLHDGREPAAPSTARTAGRRSSFDLLRPGPLRQLLLVNGLLSACWDVHAFMVPLLGHRLGLSASVIGSILGAFAIAATLIRLTMPWLSRHAREMNVVGIAMVLTGLWFALYPLSTQAWAMGLLSTLLGMSLGSVQPMVMSTLHQVTPRERQGEALGLRIMTIYGSSVVMPLAFGAIGSVVGPAPIFWCIGALVGGGSRLAFGMARQLTPSGPRAPTQG